MLPSDLPVAGYESSTVVPYVAPYELTDTALKLSKVIEREAKRRSVVRSQHVFRPHHSVFQTFRRVSSKMRTESGRSTGRSSTGRQRSSVAPTPENEELRDEETTTPGNTTDRRRSIGETSATSRASSMASMSPSILSTPRTSATNTNGMPSTIPEDSKLSSNIRQTSFRATSVLDDDEDEPPLTLLGKCWQFFDDPNSSTPAYYFSLTLFSFIILSTVVFVAQTEDALSPYTNVLGTIETICAIVFTTELGLRLLFAPSKWQFAKYYGNWIDVAAILPYYLEAVLKVENAGSFGAIRIVRLTRVARVLKMSRYSSAIQVFVQAISISIKALSMLLFLMSIAMIVFSSAIYFAEYTPDGCRRGGWIGQCAPVSTGSGMNGTLASTVAAAAAMTAMNTQNCICVDPNPYKSIASSFWWCIVTMSTVGYGDMTPVTLPGKVIGCATVLTGMLVLALPITVIGTNFQKVMKSVVQQTMKTNVDYLKGKRQICREEIQAILQRFHAVTEDIHLDIEDIINVYDTDNSGTLEDEELARFRHDLEMLQNRAFMNQHLPSAVELRGAAVVPTSAVRASVSSASPFDPYVSIDPSCDGVSGVESLVETDKRHKSLSRAPTNSGLGPSMAPSDVRASRASTSRPSDGSSPSVESVVHSFHASPPPSRSSSPVGRVHSMSRRSSDMRPVDDDLLCTRLLEMQRMWEERLLETETRLEAKLLNLNKIMLRIESMMEQED